MEMQQTKSKVILDELKRRGTKEKIVDVEEETVKVVIFSLFDEIYAFNGPEVKEILPLLPVYTIPGSPDFMPGVINIRGDIESVININRFLGLPDSTPSEKSRIAIVDRDGIRSGIMVDSVEEVIDIPTSSVQPPLSTLNKAVREYVAGEFMYQNRNVTILDTGKIFGRLGS